MSCDPTWEVCDSPAAPPAESTDASAAPAEGAGPKGAQAASAAANKVTAIQLVNMLWGVVLANVWWIGYNSYWVSSTYVGQLSDATTQNGYYDSSTYKATKYIGMSLLAYGTVGWITFVGNIFFDGKGGPLQQATQYVVQAAMPMGALMWLLTGWRSFSRDDCSSNATQWQCTLDDSTNVNKWTNKTYTNRSRQSFLLGYSLMFTSFATRKVIALNLAKMKALNAEESEGKADADAAKDADADASADASTDASSSSDNAW